jgi:hypothetical protein
MIMATAFVSLPLVIRELVPVLTEIGTDAEQAARSLGASPLQAFLSITLPAIKWALLYGVVLSLARSLGEFGAVKIVSGGVAMRTADRNVAGRGALPAVRSGEHHYRLHRGLDLGPDSRARAGGRDQLASQGELTMSIKITGVGKRFGDFVALSDIDLDIPTWPAHRAARDRAAAANRLCCESSPGWNCPIPARWRSKGPTPPTCRRKNATSASSFSTTQRSGT